MNYYDELRREVTRIEASTYYSNEEKLERLIRVIDILTRTLDEQAQEKN